MEKFCYRQCSIQSGFCIVFLMLHVSPNEKLTFRQAIVGLNFSAASKKEVIHKTWLSSDSVFMPW